MNIIKRTGMLPLWVIAALALAANVEAQSNLDDGLLAYYPFSGNADDATGNGHDGEVMNAVLTTNRFGQADSAYAFDGSNSMIVVSNSADLEPLQDFSVSLWVDVVKVPAPAVQQEWYIPLIGKYFPYGGPGEWILTVMPGNTEGGLPSPSTSGPWLALVTSSSSTISHINFPTNLWFQAVFTFQSTSAPVQVSWGICNAYLNGVLVDSRPELVYENTDPSPLIMGTIGGFSAREGYAYFDGILDDVRIYDRALSSNDVQQLYADEAGPPVRPQVDTHKAVHLEFSNLTVGVQYQLQFSHNRHRWIDAGAPFTATATTQSETVNADHFDAHGVDWRLQIAP